jgi:hypothetical protein
MLALRVLGAVHHQRQRQFLVRELLTLVRLLCVVRLH